MNLKFNLHGYEAVTEKQGYQLVGGFSRTFSEPKYTLTEGSNNCLGTNCASNCGDYGNIDATCGHNNKPCG